MNFKNSLIQFFLESIHATPYVIVLMREYKQFISIIADFPTNMNYLSF
jgi:hypothetical protein